MAMKTFGGKDPIMQKFLGNYVDDESIYAQEVREILMEEGQISGSEEGFMRGYEDSEPWRIEEEFFDDEEQYVR
jgi:hypothetical protein